MDVNQYLKIIYRIHYETQLLTNKFFKKIQIQILNPNNI